MIAIMNVTESSAPVLMTLRVSPQMKRTIKTAAETNHLTINETATLLLEAGLDTIASQHGDSIARYIVHRQNTRVDRTGARNGTRP